MFQKEIEHLGHITIRVTVRAKKTEYIGRMSDGAYKFRLKAVPEDGKANRELLDWINKNTGSEWEIIS